MTKHRCKINGSSAPSMPVFLERSRFWEVPPRAELERSLERWQFRCVIVAGCGAIGWLVALLALAQMR